jgi:hypothetical protein
MKNLSRTLRQALLGAVAASTTLLAACGSGSSAPASTTSTTTNSIVSNVPTAKVACANIAGSTGAADAAQTQISSALMPQLGQVPQVGATLQEVMSSVVQMLDVADIVTNGLQGLAATRDPLQLSSTVENSVTALRCALNPLDASLLALQNQLPAGSIPQIGDADLRLQYLAGSLDSLLGVSGKSVNLSQLSTALHNLNPYLNSIAVQVQSRLPANSPLTPAFSMVATQMNDLETIFDRVAALDDAGVADAVTMEVQDVASALNGNFADSVNLPAVAMLGPANLLTGAVASITSSLSSLNVSTILATLSSVLTSLLGSTLGLG